MISLSKSLLLCGLSIAVAWMTACAGTQHGKPPANAIAPTPPTSLASAPNPAFRPSLHGFPFVNSFKGSPLPPALRPLQPLLGTGVPARFGLCGGMSLAAADYYLAHRPVPSASATPPAEGTALYAYLYLRQSDSFEGLMLPTRVLRCMALPDTGPEGLQAMTAQELPEIERRLTAQQAGVPGLVPLCLILVKSDGKAKPWENHQVLAYGVRTVEGVGGIKELRIYDPNFPGDDQAVLRLEPTADGYACTRIAHRPGDAREESASQAPPRTIRTRVRGVFGLAYQAPKTGLPGNE